MRPPKKLRALKRTINFIVNHPLNANRKASALLRLAAWQMGSRIVPGPVVIDFVNNSRLLVCRGGSSAIGNFYVGLHEFEDMAFVLHLLRQDDLFVDIGANVGVYTVLAGAVVGANCISAEPVPETFQAFLDNVNLNHIYSKVKAHNIGLGEDTGTCQFTAKLGVANHVITNGHHTGNTIDVPVKKLDDLLEGLTPSLIKIDVEGFETQVITGANRILSQTSPLVVIMEYGLGNRYGFDEIALHQTMLQFGFEPFAYEPFARQLTSLKTETERLHNVLYVKDAAQVTERVKTAPQFTLGNGQKI